MRAKEKEPSCKAERQLSPQDNEAVRSCPTVTPGGRLKTIDSDSPAGSLRPRKGKRPSQVYIMSD